MPELLNCPAPHHSFRRLWTLYIEHEVVGKNITQNSIAYMYIDSNSLFKDAAVRLSSWNIECSYLKFHKLTLTVRIFYFLQNRMNYFTNYRELLYKLWRITLQIMENCFTNYGELINLQIMGNWLLFKLWKSWWYMEFSG